MNVLFKKTLSVLLAAVLLLTVLPFAATAAEVTEKSVGASSGIPGNYTVYAVGNGEGWWLRGAIWDPAYAANEMTEVADDVWEIAFKNVPDGFERQIKFAIDGTWTHNFGGVFEDSGVVSDAVYNGDNITFDTDDVCTVKAQLDLSNFDLTTKQGAKFTVTIDYGEESPAEAPTSGTTGDCTWNLTADGTLTISGNGAMGNYDAPWGNKIKKVVIKDGVTSVGAFAFYNCTGLTSVSIGNSVTSINSCAFYNCTGLTSVIIPASVTRICGSAFYYCTGLTSVTIPNSVTSIGGSAFSFCKGLTSVTIGSSVTSIGERAFSACTLLTSVTIPDSVTSIGNGAFDNTAWYNNQPKGLVYAGKVVYKYKGTMPQNTSITIKDGTKGIAYMAFYGCTGLTSVTIPNRVTSIGSSAFYNCTGLTSVTIPNSVTSIGEGAFINCTGLTSVTIGNSVTSIGSSTFYGCKSLTSVTIPDSVTSIGYEAFYNCTGLTSVIIGNSVTSIDSYAFSGCTGLTSVTIPNSVKSIGTQAFQRCTGLTSVYIPDSVTSIDEYALGYYYNNGYQKVAGFTIYGTPGSEAQRYANDNGFIFEEVSPEEPTEEPIITGGLTLTATSNISSETTTHFSSSRLAEQNNYITVSYCVQSEMKLVNCDWLLTYDGTVLQFDEEANTTGEGRNAKLDVMPSVSDEFVNTNPTSVEYGISGNCTDLNAYYLDNDNGGRVAFVTVTFKVIGPGSTTVDLRVGDMRLTNKMWGESTVDYETQAVLDGAVLTDTLPDFDTRVYLGKYNEDYIVCAEAPTEPTEEPTIDPDTILDYSSVYAVGNGKGTWLNSISWRPSAALNQMTEIAEDVWKIVYSDVPAGNDYQVRFAIDGAWTHSFGGVFKGSGVVSDAVYDGDNITFNTHTDCDIIIRLDLSDFNLKTKEGAKFTVTIEDYVEETTAAVEETTEAVEETTEAVEETTEAVEETTEAVEETTTPAEEDDTFIVAGSEPEIFGTGWDGTNTDNLMTKQGDGTYTKDYTVEKAYDAVQLKAVKNGADWIGDKTGKNVTFNVTGEGTFTVTYHPAAGEEPEYVEVTGDNVELITEFNYNTVYAVGNGEGTWLNDANWDPAYSENKMTEIIDEVWEIEFENVPEGLDRQIKFTIDGDWPYNFGGAFVESGVETPADFNGDNITFDTDDTCTVKAQLDLRNFDFVTKTGAKFTLTITYDDVEETTEAYEETTANPEETTAPVEEGTTEAYEETTANYEETTSHVEDTTSVPANSLIVKATSNLFPQTVNAYNNLSAYEDGNGNVFVTVEYKLAAPGQYLINLDVEEFSWDPAVLEFKEAYNIMGYGRQAKFTIFPFAFEQGLGAGMVNTFGDDNGGRLVGSYTSVLPAAYATEEDNVSPVTVVRAVFKVLDREAGVTTVDCLIDALALCDDTIAEPYVQHRLVYNGVVDQDILDNCTVQTIIKPEGQVVPPVEETTTPEETTEAQEETTEAYEETTAPAEEGTTEYYEATTCAPEYCTVSGISNYCQAVAAREIEVGDTVTVSFKAPEDREIVDIQWGMNYDKDLLELTEINSFDGGRMLVNPNAESYNVMGSYSNISTPASITKGGNLITFVFTVKGGGETTVDLNVVDMTIRIDNEDQIRVENGEIKNICTHKTTRTIPGYPATCTQAGLTDEIVCAECGKVMTKAVVIPAKGHTPVADQAKAATCTETGLTEGSHCSVCNEVLVEQIEIPALGHLPVLDPYLAPTCSHEGHTAGSHCARCGEVFVQGEPIAKLPHTEVLDEAVEPSCGHTGLTEGSHCSVCGEVIVAQDVIPALKHQYEIVPAVPATYTKEGSTDGVRCKRCGEWLIAPQVIPKKPIDFTFGDVNEDGKVNIRDVTAIQRFLAEYTDLTERQRGAADVNFDGVVDVRDATLLQMYFAEFDVTLG